MKRIIMMFALTALLVVALSMSALSAFAVPFNQNTCEGTFENNQGTKTCKQTSDRPSGFTQTDTRRGPTITEGECTNRGGGNPSPNNPNCP